MEISNSKSNGSMCELYVVNDGVHNVFPMLDCTTTKLHLLSAFLLTTMWHHVKRNFPQTAKAAVVAASNCIQQIESQQTDGAFCAEESTTMQNTNNNT